jgi:carboxylesterase type B
LARLDSKILLQANSDVVYKANYGDFAYGPTVDGGFVPDYPGTSLLKGHFDRSPHLMLGHNSHEDDIFTPPTINSRETIAAKLRMSIHGIRDSAIDYILNDLYPSPSKTSLYTTEHERSALLLSEYIFVCNSRYLATSFRNDTWNYRFQVAPGNHAQDLAYTFFVNNATAAANVDSELAMQIQLYFTQFAAKSNPNKPALLPHWPHYGRDAEIATFGSDGVGTATDDARNERCAYWQQGTYAAQG